MFGNHELGHYLTYHHVSQQFFRGHRDKFDGLVIPLSVATVFRQGTGGFVLTLKKPYFIDPRSPLFQSDFDRSSIRRAHEEMAVVHGPVFQQVFPTRALAPTDFSPTVVDETARNVLDFQKRFANTSTEKVQKYARLLGEEAEETYGPPECLLPPYFRAMSVGDPWYGVSHRLALAAAQYKEGQSLVPVIHISPKFPPTEFARVATDYRDQAFDGLIVFFNDLREYDVQPEILGAYARMVVTLRQNAKPLLGLFGGYFSLLMRKIGLPSFSNAVGYGEYRDSSYHEGGQAVRRYYLPALHRYFTDIEARTLLDTIDEDWFRCGCRVCRTAAAITELTSQQLLDHFLAARYSELQDANRARLGDLLRALLQTVRRLEPTPIPPNRYEHLVRWVQALRPYTEEG